MLDSLWTPTAVGGISLPYRLVMAPMTRDRSTPEGVPTELNAESDTAELYPALLDALRPLGLAYLHVMHAGEEALLETLRAQWPATLIFNRGGTDVPTRAKDIDNGTADLVSVAALALANPDLVERLRAGAELNAPDPATYYGGGTAGYTDYPAYTA